MGRRSGTHTRFDGTGPVSAPQTAAVTPASASDAGDINSAEITRGIQRELNSRGYEAGQPDGVAGLVTRAAIYAYEYDNGLVLTGKPSDPLLSQIVLGSSSLTPDNARSGKKITADGESFGAHGEAATFSAWL